MSIFITLLAFSDPEIIQASKASVLLTSLCAGVTGYVILSRRTPRVKQPST
jgi:NhaA family Na+:H+ antiporter